MRWISKTCAACARSEAYAPGGQVGPYDAPLAAVHAHVLAVVTVTVVVAPAAAINAVVGAMVYEQVVVGEEGVDSFLVQDAANNAATAQAIGISRFGVGHPRRSN